MNTVDFFPKTFREIPDQDNPATGDEECLMLVREDVPDRASMRVVVLFIQPSDDDHPAENVAIFWRHDRAQRYCETWT